MPSLSGRRKVIRRRASHEIALRNMDALNCGAVSDVLIPSSMTRRDLVRSVLPNFFVVGAAGSGTTSLYHYLDQHPDVYMSPIKGPSYFAPDARPDRFLPGFRKIWDRQQEGLDAYLDGDMREKRSGLTLEWEQYLKLFKRVDGEQAIGEASVSYLWSEGAAENIRRAVPEAKIVMVLRNPVDRAFTSYATALAEGWLRGGFREVIETDRKRESHGFGRSLMFLEGGLYYEQVKRFLDRFPADRVKIYLYDQYAADPLALLRDLFGFLGVDPAFTPDVSVRYHRSEVPRFPALHGALVRGRKLSRLVPGPLRAVLRSLVFRTGRRPTLGPGDRRFLEDYYRENVKHLGTLLRRELSTWFT